MRRSLPTLFAVIIAFAVRTAALHAQAWSTDPTVNSPVTTAASSQINQDVAYSGDGGTLIVWEDYRNGATADIYMQKFNGVGTPLWAANGIPVCAAINNQLKPKVIGDGAGGAIVTWQDLRFGSFYDVYAQRIDVNGNRQWALDGIAVCSAGGDQRYPQLTKDGAGGAIITWEDGRGSARIYAQRIDPSGNIPAAPWVADGIPVSSPQLYPQIVPEIVSDGVGGAIVAWSDFRNSGDYGIYAQRIDPGGNLLWGGSDLLISNTSFNQMSPELALDGGGGVIFTWLDFRNTAGATADIYAQRALLGGSIDWATPNGIAVCTAINTQSDLTMVGDGTGGAIIAWADFRSGSAWDIYAQRVLGGAVQWAANGIPICSAPQNQYSPSADRDGAGGMIVAWTDFRVGGTVGDIYAQRVAPTGIVQWAANGLPISTAINDQSYQEIASNVPGESVIVWTDMRNGAVTDLYAQKILPDGTFPLPPYPLNLTATPGPGQIALTWDPVVGATGFLVYYGTSPGVYNGVGAVQGNSPVSVIGNGITLTGLTGGTTYFVAVSTLVGATEGGKCPEVSATVPAPPSAPTLALDPASDSGVSNSDFLTFDNTPTFTGSTSPGATVILYRNGVSVTSIVANALGLFTVTSPVIPNGPSNFTATASTVAGSSGPSSPVAIMVDTTAPAPPTLALDPASDTGISNSDGATSDNTPTFTGSTEPNALIILYRGGVSVGSTTASAAGLFSVTSPAVPDGPSGFAASAYDPAGNPGPASPPVNVLVDTVQPSAGIVGDGVSGDFDFQISTTTIEANWGGFNDAGGIAYYEWAIGTTPGGTNVQGFTPIGTTTIGINAALTLTPGQTYYATVRAVDQVGLAVPATSDGVLVGNLTAPANLAAIAGDGQIALAWDPMVGAATFNVYYGTALGDTAGTGAAQGTSPVSTASNSIVLTGLTNLQTYFFAVTAVSPAGIESGPSNVVFATPGSPNPAAFVRQLPGGSMPESYRIISIPMISSATDPISNLTDDLGPYDPTQWRMFTFDPAGGGYVEVGMPGFPPPLPGRAYWIISLAGGPIDIEGTPVDASQDFVITLRPGWNMVGHPFIFPVDWADATANGVPIGDPGENGFISENLWDWVGGYVAAPQLVPSRGYWIRNRTTGPVELRIPPIAAPIGPIYPSSKPQPSPIMDRRTSGDDLPPLPPGTPSAAASGGGGGGGGCYITETSEPAPPGTPLIAALFLLVAFRLARRGSPRKRRA